jgi:hypothetical protein
MFLLLLLLLYTCRLITVNTIKVPEGVDWAKLVKNAMDKFNLEIAGGAQCCCEPEDNSRSRAQSVLHSAMRVLAAQRHDQPPPWLCTQLCGYAHGKRLTSDGQRIAGAELNLFLQC